MPLNIGALQSGIEGACASPSDTAAGSAGQWADAVKGYASAVVPLSTAVDAAAATLEGALTSAFSAPEAAPLMETAFAAFAASVGVGMLPAFAAVPPAGPVGFASQFAGPAPATHAQAASAVAGLIDAWMKTGTATLVAPPNTQTSWS
jgi:hypothetical protein